MEMILEQTLSEATVLRSVKKFFIDTFKYYEDLPIFFDYVDRQPTVNEEKVNRWLCVVPRSNNYDTLAAGYFQLHLFVAKDKDGMQVAEFRDLVFGKLIDFDQTDCRVRIPFYNSTWEIQFYGVLHVQNELNTITFEDGKKTKIIPIVFYWGAK